MIRCIIIEDQEPAQRILKRYISNTGGIELCGVFYDALSAMDFLKEQTIDLIFLDIHLPKLSGLDFLSLLSPQPHVILTTAFSDYAVRSYEYDVVDYLLKPFSFDRFLKAILKVKGLSNDPIEQIEQKENNRSFLIKVGHDMVRFDPEAILYIKSDGDYSHIYTETGRFVVSYTLKYWHEKLKDFPFIKAHRSYLVNLLKVQKVSAMNLIIHETEIPLGRVYKKDFLEAFRKL